MKRLLPALLVPLLLSACGPSPTSISYSDAAGYPMPSASPSSVPLADLLTGQVISGDEQQLRDIQKRRIVLDFPIKVGVIYYQYQSKLDEADREKVFDDLSAALQADGRVRETIQIPSTLVGSSIGIEELRKLGARFQTDVVVLIGGSHDFERARNQNLSFFDSFSDKSVYESQVKLDAITLDVYTGTLLSPFNAAYKAQPITLDRAASTYQQQVYTYQQQAEVEAWKGLQQEAIERIQQLEADVKRNLATAPSPTPVALPTPGGPRPAPTPTPTPTPEASPQEGVR
ncbi:MAG: hypothetical protein ACO1RX_03560 [Candidatus Sericytochromatia bacterium]